MIIRLDNTHIISCSDMKVAFMDINILNVLKMLWAIMQECIVIAACGDLQTLKDSVFFVVVEYSIKFTHLLLNHFALFLCIGYTLQWVITQVLRKYMEISVEGQYMNQFLSLQWIFITFLKFSILFILLVVEYKSWKL